MRLLRTAVIGVGFVGPHHIDAVRRGGYADVVVVADINSEKARSKARLMNIKRFTSDVSSILSDPAIDVVHVCTPNVTHAKLATAVLEAGKHVVVDKPLACRGDDASALVEAARRSGHHAAVTFVYRGYPMVRRARELRIAGELGELRLVHGTYLQDWLSTEADYSWRVDPALAGESRVVADVGTHLFDTLEYVGGARVQSVLADLALFIPIRQRPMADAEAFGGGGGSSEPIRVETEDAATVLLRFEGGGRGACVLSQISPGYKNAFTFSITGSDRSIAWEQESPEQLWLGARTETHIVVRDAQIFAGQPGTPGLPAGHVMGYASAWRDVLRPFYAAIAAGAPPPTLDQEAPYPTFSDGARAVRFVEAVLRSSREGRWCFVGGQ